MAARPAHSRRPLAGLGCVILAAGASRRFGRPKQLARHRAVPLLARALDAAARAVPTRPVVVLGANAVRLRAMLRRMAVPCAVVLNPGWTRGLASSLQAGLDALPAGARAVLVVLADQPHVDAAALRGLARAWRRRPGLPAAASYAGRIGVPAILPRRTWPALRALEGDMGARRVLGAAPRVTAVAMPEAALDVDRPEDLARLRRGRPSRN